MVEACEATDTSACDVILDGSASTCTDAGACSYTAAAAAVAESCEDADGSGDDCSGFTAGDESSCAPCDYTAPEAAVAEACAATDAQACADVTLPSDAATCTGAGGCTYTAAGGGPISLPPVASAAPATGLARCKPGFTPANADPLTVRCGSDGQYTLVSGDITCTDANVCSAMDAGSLAALGYTAATATADTVAGLGAIDCAAGFALADPGVPASVACDGAAFSFSGCCVAVANAAPGATYTCTAAGSRVSACADSYTHVTGGAGASDTCAANVCSAMDTAGLAALGYTATTADADTVAGLGTVGCAAGFALADSGVPATASCDGGAFSFAGCVEGCTGSSPGFLDGVDTLGAFLPIGSADPAAT